MESVTLSLISHTNVGKTTLARTLLREDVGEALDHAHVTDENVAYALAQTESGAQLTLWDTPGFGDTARLMKRLRKVGSPVGWVLHQVWDRITDRPLWCSQQAVLNVRDEADVEMVKQMESKRMSWCLADVVAVHGDANLSHNGNSHVACWDCGPTQVIYPDLAPGAVEIESTPIPVPADASRNNSAENSTHVNPAVYPQSLPFGTPAPVGNEVHPIGTTKVYYSQGVRPASFQEPVPGQASSFRGPPIQGPSPRPSAQPEVRRKRALFAN